MNIAIMCNVSCEKTHNDRVELIKELENKGHKVFVFGVSSNDNNMVGTVNFVTIKASRNNINPFKEIASLFNIIKTVRKNRIDAAVIYGVKNHSAMAIGARLGGCKNILCVVNGSGNLFLLKGLKGLFVRFMSFHMLRIAYACAKNVNFQNSDDLWLFSKKHLINRKKAFVTGGSGVNLETFEQKPMSKEPRFLFLARITPSKGLIEYVEAARIIKKKYPNAIFDVVGPIDNAVEENINDILENAMKEGIVTYHGPTSDVPTWLEKCRFFVYPSFYREGVPRCAIQAIATGRPIITCDSPGCKETVIDGVNGFMIPAKDFSKLAEKMECLLLYPDESEKMALESRKYAEEKFDVTIINDILLERLFIK